MRTRYHIDASKVAPIDWARLAAYIDGEGSIYVTGRARTQLVIEVTNTDIRLPLWCKSIFDGLVVVCKLGKRGRIPAARWRVLDSTAETIIRNCMEYFVIKREQAEVALVYRETYRHKGGHDKVTADQLNQRHVLRTELSRLKREIPVTTTVQ